MALLTKLLSRLPPLEPCSSWSSRWYLDLPLCCVVKPIDGKSPSLDPFSVAPRYLFSDLSDWVLDRGIVSSVVVGSTDMLSIIPDIKSKQVKKVLWGLNDRNPRSPGATLCLPPVVRAAVAFATDEYASLPFSPGASSWLPETDHWTIPTSSKSSCAISSLRLGALRRFWHHDSALMLSPPRPPAAMSTNWLLRPYHWRLFWSLRLPPSGFTPWWRLLHDRIGHRTFLHRIMPTIADSSLCPLCRSIPEDLYHFVIGCPLKSAFWRDVLSFLLLDDDFPRDLQVWCALSSLSDLYSGSPLSRDVLVILGVAFTTLWKYHWRCVFDNEPWSTDTCFRLFQQEQSLYISSFFSSREA